MAPVRHSSITDGFPHFLASINNDKRPLTNDTLLFFFDLSASLFTHPRLSPPRMSSHTGDASVSPMCVPPVCFRRSSDSAVNLTCLSMRPVVCLCSYMPRPCCTWQGLIANVLKKNTAEEKPSSRPALALPLTSHDPRLIKQPCPCPGSTSHSPSHRAHTHAHSELVALPCLSKS